MGVDHTLSITSLTNFPSAGKEETIRTMPCIAGNARRDE